MPSEKEIEAAAREMCKWNGNCIHEHTGEDLCPRPEHDCRDWKHWADEAEAALMAAERVRPVHG